MRNRTHAREIRTGSTCSVTTASSHQRMRPPRADKLYVSIVSLPPLNPNRESKDNLYLRNWRRSSNRLLVAAPRTTDPEGRRRRAKTPVASIHGSTGVLNRCSTGPATAAQSHACHKSTKAPSHPGAGSSSSSIKTSASASLDKANARLRAADIPGLGS